MQSYYRPLCRLDTCRPENALTLAGGWCWFDQVERLRRDSPPQVIPAADLPEDWRARLTAPRTPVAGLAMDLPRVMGILNVTPDSFSDGGAHFSGDAALGHASAMAAAGADILDVGGESTRPGAQDVPVDEEIRRTAPVIAALRAAGLGLPVSIDTRKAAVAEAARAAGADILNDVAALSFDPALAGWAAQARVPVCVMHAQGDPATMQDDPRYDDVLLDVYDFLSDRLAEAVRAGIDRSRLIVDPGIGFGKTEVHNLSLLRGMALFHGLGCPILLGASRKRFVGAIGGAPAGPGRTAGSLAVALGALGQGVQILRVHDVAETVQALRLWRAVELGHTGE